MPISLTVVVALSIFLICNIYTAKADPSLCEHYNTGDDWSHSFYGTYWMAQTFKVGSSEHSATSVKIKAYRSGTPGNVTASIRALDASDHPTGEDLANGTTDGNSFTVDNGGAWYEITLTECTLFPNTSYAIVLRATEGNFSKRIFWRGDDSIPNYYDGNEEFSEYNGSTWLSYETTDLMFEIWGNVPSSTPTPTPTPVIPEFPSWAIVMLFFAIVTLLTVAFGSKKLEVIKVPVIQVNLLKTRAMVDNNTYHKKRNIARTKSPKIGRIRKHGIH